MANYGSKTQRAVADDATIDLNRVHAFIRVVEDGSFTAAAKRLGLPKSSVSRSITALERSLGVRLLQRTTRALHLTDAGRTWFQQVRPAVASLTDSTASVRALGTEPRGRVRVSAAPDATEWLSSYVARFRKKYPKVQLELSFSSRHVDLAAEGFDLAVRAGTLTDASLVVRRIEASNLTLFASAAYLRRAGAPKRLAELAEHECIGMNAQGGRVTWSLTGPSQALESVELDCAVSTDLLGFAARACALGMGIALLPEVFAGSELVRVLPQYRKVGGSLNVVSPSRGFEPRAVALFKEGLVDELLKMTAKCTKHVAKQLTR
ncbi:MAG: LysR family transcriptional regulator [Archangiaceae bacterium]|nr:LysR family transcriptional regulator [Archangiaceae bacterium]